MKHKSLLGLFIVVKEHLVSKSEDIVSQYRHEVLELNGHFGTGKKGPVGQCFIHIASRLNKVIANNRSWLLKPSKLASYTMALTSGLHNIHTFILL